MDKNKVFCNHGHELKGDNLFINNRNHRCCKECKKRYSKNYRKKIAGEKLILQPINANTKQKQ